MLRAAPLPDLAVDRHYLTPLFNPRSIVAFAGDPEGEAPTREAALLRQALAEGTALGYAGPVTWLDIGMRGTLAELAQSRADLALIALPHEQVPAALEIVGRVRCRAALVLSSGMAHSAGSNPHPVPLPPSGRGDAAAAPSADSPLSRSAGEGWGEGSSAGVLSARSHRPTASAAARSPGRGIRG